MDYLKQFVIPFGGLKPGVHQFSFEIDDLFFDQFEQSEIKKAKIKVDISLEREEKLLLLNFVINGTVEFLCDRCYEPFLLPVSGNERLIVKFGDHYQEEDDEVQIIPAGETEIDVSPFIYEFVHLMIPYRRVHPEDENGNSLCNPDIIKRIDEREETSGPDPRWEVLKKLKTNN
jgi:uncharacterized metal-binding protein YceD (DUF177 family)